MERLILSIKESYNELVNKVTWPKWPNLQSSTILVLVASLIIAFLVFIMDTVSKQVVDLIYGI
jgi:preprotein translocase subunit SecE